MKRVYLKHVSYEDSLHASDGWIERTNHTDRNDGYDLIETSDSTQRKGGSIHYYSHVKYHLNDVCKASCESCCFAKSQFQVLNW